MPHPVSFSRPSFRLLICFFFSCGVSFLGLGSTAVEEVPEAGDEPDGAAGGGEAPAGREREAAEGELGAQQRLSIWLPHALQRFLISLPSVCFFCFLFSALYEPGYG